MEETGTGSTQKSVVRSCLRGGGGERTEPPSSAKSKRAGQSWGLECQEG